MLGTAIDTAIGLVLTFLLFSILLTIGMEILSGLLGSRAKALETVIAGLIEGSGNARVGATAMAFGPPAALAQTPAPAASDAPNAEPPPLSYADVYRHPLVAGPKPNPAPSYVPAANFASALVDLLCKRGGGVSFRSASVAVYQLSNANLRTLLQALLDESANDLDAFRAGIARWFDSAMDRLSGAYKRFTQVVTFSVGLLLAAGLNVDAIHVARTLYADPPLRAAMVSAAEAQVKQSPSAAKSAPAAIAAQLGDFAKAESDLTQVAPVGWPSGPYSFDAWVGLGWLLTALAGLLGAPFWFDTLQTIVNVRNAGPKPNSSTSGSAS
jgi:hypothetical protein